MMGENKRRERKPFSVFRATLLHPNRQKTTSYNPYTEDNTRHFTNNHYVKKLHHHTIPIFIFFDDNVNTELRKVPGEQPVTHAHTQKRARAHTHKLSKVLTCSLKVLRVRLDGPIDS